MDIKEIVNLLYTAIDLAADGGPTAFTDEEYSEMHELLKKIKSGRFGWHPASELPPVDKNGNSGELIAITSDNNLMRVYFHYESDEYNFWVESDDWNKQVKYGVNVKCWCYPPLND